MLAFQASEVTVAARFFLTSLSGVFFHAFITFFNEI
jgi:hypothetical protein